MFNLPSVVSNDQPAMRPIMKRPQSSPSVTVDSFTSSQCSDKVSLSSHHTAQTVVNADCIPASYGYNNYCGRTIASVLLPDQYIRLVNSLTTRARKSVTDLNHRHDVKRVFKINENAVRLDDIDEWWYTENETVTLPGSRQHKEYDDVDLDLFTTHKEAQEFNDLGDFQQKLDFFFLKSTLQHISSYLKDYWFDLTQSQRLLLCLITNHHKLCTIFDHLVWFGYDCLIRSPSEEFLTKAAEYNNFIKNVLGILSEKMKKDANDLAIDFGISFSYSNAVIATCNKHFEKSQRRRMPYTKRFVATY